MTFAYALDRRKMSGWNVCDAEIRWRCDGNETYSAELIPGHLTSSDKQTRQCLPTSTLGVD